MTFRSPSDGPDPRRERSTISRAVAARFGFIAHLDTGAALSARSGGGMLLGEAAGRGRPERWCPKRHGPEPERAAQRPRWPRAASKVPPLIPEVGAALARFPATPSPDGRVAPLLDGPRHRVRVICPNAEVKLFRHRKRRGAGRAALQGTARGGARHRLRHGPSDVPRPRCPRCGPHGRTVLAPPGRPGARHAARWRWRQAVGNRDCCRPLRCAPGWASGPRCGIAAGQFRLLTRPRMRNAMDRTGKYRR